MNILRGFLPLVRVVDIRLRVDELLLKLRAVLRELLAGLAHLSSLMELYIGNNEVHELPEVDHLKSLPKLIIVDLSGNQLCNALQPTAAYSDFNLPVVE